MQVVIRHQPLHGLADLTRADEAAALELPLRSRMAGAPAEVRVDEFLAAVRPATIAYVEIDDPVGGKKLIIRQGKTGNHDYRRARTPGQVREGSVVRESL